MAKNILAGIKKEQGVEKINTKYIGNILKSRMAL